MNDATLSFLESIDNTTISPFLLIKNSIEVSKLESNFPL